MSGMEAIFGGHAKIAQADWTPHCCPAAQTLPQNFPQASGYMTAVHGPKYQDGPD